VQKWKQPFQELKPRWTALRGRLSEWFIEWACKLFFDAAAKGIADFDAIQQLALSTAIPVIRAIDTTVTSVDTTVTSGDTTVTSHVVKPPIDTTMTSQVVKPPIDTTVTSGDTTVTSHVVKPPIDTTMTRGNTTVTSHVVKPPIDTTVTSGNTTVISQVVKTRIGSPTFLYVYVFKCGCVSLYVSLTVCVS